MLQGVRGPHGGYRLADERRNITVGWIIAVVEGLEEDDSGVPTSTASWRKPHRPALGRTRGELMGILTITVEDLCQRAQASIARLLRGPCRRSGGLTADFAPGRMTCGPFGTLDGPYPSLPASSLRISDR
ncbi:MAG: hypothetical protein R3C97_13080 [Geminicoccaceae bacterium]